MKFINLKLILGLVLFLFKTGYCQNKQQEVTLPSPNVASLGIYGEIPVSQFSGQSSISIPFYSLNEGSIKLPISLKYLGTGVKPDVHPSWVGMNWSLNAGGLISRKINDLPDDYDCPETELGRNYFNLPFSFTEIEPIYGKQAGYYFNRHVNYFDNWLSEESIKSLVNDNKDYLDTEPDEFIFNFLGYSGKFYLNSMGKWVVQSDQNIKVIFEDNNFVQLPDDLLVSQDNHPQAYCLRNEENMKCFGGFTLITDSGTKYIFGTNTEENNRNTIEYSIPFFQQLNKQWIATTWCLNKIVDAESNEITFSYEVDDFISSMYLYYLHDYVSYYDEDDNKSDVPYSQAYSYKGEYIADWITPKYDSYMGNLIRPVYLTKINGANINIEFIRSNSDELNYNKDIYVRNRKLQEDFIYSDSKYSVCYYDDVSVEKNISWPFLYDKIQSADHSILIDALVWKKLDKIKIMSNSNSNGIEYDFYYDNNTNERLNLSYISKTNSLNTCVVDKYYDFEYYDNETIQLPSYLNESTDHWGYYNGNTTKCITALRDWNFVYNLPPNATQYFELRKATSSLAMACEMALKTITYPTGGKTEFIYEQHDYSRVFDISSCEDYTNCIQNDVSNPTAGGIRIKKIIDYSSSNEKIEKEYFYVEGYTPNIAISSLRSSGILCSDPEGCSLY